MCSEGHLHEDIGAGVGAGRERSGRHVAEADGFVEVDGVGESSVATKVERRGAEEAGLCNGVEQETTAEATTAELRRDGHLRELIDSLAKGNESGAADRKTVSVDYENRSTFAQNGGFGVAERLYVATFEGEVTRDPFFIKGAEGRGVVAG